MVIRVLRQLTTSPKPQSDDAADEAASTRLEDLQFRLEYGLLRFIVWLVRRFPIDTGANISALVWRNVAPWSYRHKRAHENLALAFPDMPLAERNTIITSMWDNLGRVMAETMQIDRILAEEEARFEHLSQHLYQRYRNKMGAAIGVTLHMGNWEFAAWPMAKMGTSPAAVYRLVKNPYVDRYIRKQREPLYPSGMLAKGRAHGGSNAEGQKTARQIMGYVRQGGRLGLVCDLFDRHGLPVDFFGHPARSTPIAGLIARRVGARIWMGRCIRKGRTSRFQLELKELKVPRNRNQAEDIRWITAEMQKQFEEWVREHPEQWMWSNRRWK